jgi:hypothetical protein
MGVRSLINAKVQVTAVGTLRNQANNNIIVQGAVPKLDYVLGMVDGFAAGQSDRSWQCKGSLLNGQTRTFDLGLMDGIDIGAGTGKDGLGQPVNFASVVAVVIVNNNAPDDPGLLEVYPDPVNGWSSIGSHTVANGGALGGQGLVLKTAPDLDGFPIDQMSNHQLTIGASGGTTDYSIYLITRSTCYGEITWGLL